MCTYPANMREDGEIGMDWPACKQYLIRMTSPKWNRLADIFTLPANMCFVSRDPLPEPSLIKSVL